MDFLLDGLKKLFSFGFEKDFFTDIIALTKQNDLLGGADLVTLITDAVIPIGLSIMVTFWLLELLEKQMDFRNGGIDLENIIMLVAKLILAKWVVENSPKVLEIFTEISNAVMNNLTESGAIIEVSFDELWKTVEKEGLLAQISFIMQYFTMAFTLAIMNALLRIAIYGRAVKIVILSCLSPIPMATIPFEQFREIGKRFLQTFFASTLQGAVIIIAVILSSYLHKMQLLGTSDFSSIKDTAEITGAFMRYLIINGTLLFVIFKSESWSESILGI